MIPKDLQVPGYDIEALLGKGGMATVYKARQQSFAREVALKVLNPNLGSDGDFTQRFMQESLIVARLHHSHIVQVYDVGQFDRYSYLCMEYLSGGDLAKKLARGLPLKETIIIIKQLASALDFAHRRNIIHRDIKPENILFREDGAAVLTDFGVAKELQASSEFTQTGLVIGTPKYMSPEQISGEEVDHRADLYALGVVFYRCLTNYVPFNGKDMMTTAYLQHHEPVPKLPEVVSCFQPLINHMLAKEANLRVQSGNEVVEALEDIQRSAYNGQLTNLDVAAAVKLAPPTVTRVNSGAKQANTEFMQRAVNAGGGRRERSEKIQPKPAANLKRVAIPGAVDNAEVNQTIVHLQSHRPGPPNAQRQERLRADEPMAPQTAAQLRRERAEKAAARRRKPQSHVALLLLMLLGVSAAAFAYWQKGHPKTSIPQMAIQMRSAISERLSELPLPKVTIQLPTLDTQSAQTAVEPAGKNSLNVLPAHEIKSEESHSGNAYIGSPVKSHRSSEQTQGDGLSKNTNRNLSQTAAVKVNQTHNLAAVEKSSAIEAGATQEEPVQNQLLTRINALLDAANHQLQFEPYSRQAALKALSQYNTVLELDSRNPSANHGVKRVAYRFIELADLAMATYKYDEAESYLLDAKAISPEQPQLYAMQRKLTRAQLAEYEKRWNMRAR